ncbi:hypothetical protein N7492_009968 [Penicillium capsulatum]|uniref:Alpha-galactosidase n=1 Tax=Penicillium capsulatum TaxID=69766 RepID=A0A9W9LEQ4_9EURO|nr:hypothetical protein N7492_009968 [Penicillium capsulatum]KAJ6112478.1 hypothetical protein N7512_007802 [Penicillium capsulatum]
MFLAPFLHTSLMTGTAVAHTRDDGLAKTPPMGWNTYNHYSCAPNDTTVQSNAQALIYLGLADLGYRKVTIDCGWTVPGRLKNGSLTWNETWFPAGFRLDSRLWGNDNCFADAATVFPNNQYTSSTSPRTRYANMTKALDAQDRSVLFQICEWGTWRIGNDIVPARRSIFQTLNQAVPQASYAGPEEQTHFSMWAILKSPLVIGGALKDDWTSMGKTSLSILTNKDVIGFNQG